MKNSEVDAWMREYDNPMKDVVETVRTLILDADERIAECIKWKAPTFTYKGNLASFNPRSKKHASLMFHTGTSIPGDFPSLEGEGDIARTMKFADSADVERKKDELEAIVKAWCSLKDD